MELRIPCPEAWAWCRTVLRVRVEDDDHLVGLACSQEACLAGRRIRQRVNGMAWTWKRWGAWSAHLFEDERQSCKTAHPMAGRREPAVLQGEALTEHGVPYGRVCPRCLKAYARLKRGEKVDVQA